MCDDYSKMEEWQPRTAKVFAGDADQLAIYISVIEDLIKEGMEIQYQSYEALNLIEIFANSSEMKYISFKLGVDICTDPVYF